VIVSIKINNDYQQCWDSLCKAKYELSFKYNWNVRGKQVP